MKEISKEIIKRSIEHYGTETQSTICMEECAELIQAISKMKRGKDDMENLSEEMADVYICLEMLMQIYGVDASKVNVWIDYKQKREEERMKE